MTWKPMSTAPLDGTEILLKTHVGIVSAWFCDDPPTNDSNDNGAHDWVCYDDMFTLEHDDSTIVGWMSLPNTPIASQPPLECSDGQPAIKVDGRITKCNYVHIN